MSKNRYILFYRNDHPVCDMFINQLKRYDDLYQTFIKFDVDRVGDRVPKVIQQIPAIKVPQYRDFIQGKETLEWLRAVTDDRPDPQPPSSSSNPPDSLDGMATEPMAAGFSGQFSSLDEGYGFDAKSSMVDTGQFVSVGDGYGNIGDKIDETEWARNNQNQSNSGNNIEAEIARKRAQRQREVVLPPRGQPNFQEPAQTSMKHDPQFDKRFEDMRNQRNNMMPRGNAPPPLPPDRLSGTDTSESFSANDFERMMAERQKEFKSLM